MHKTKFVANKKDRNNTELKGLCVNYDNRIDCRIRDTKECCKSL